MHEPAELVPCGPFSLRAAAEFGFGPNAGRPQTFDGAMRLAFPIDGGRGHAGAVLRQGLPDGPVSVELQTTEGGDRKRALRQIARIVSLDHDGKAFLDRACAGQLGATARAARVSAGRRVGGARRAARRRTPARARARARVADVQRLKGLGPFYAGLVVLRASGFADAMLPVAEPKVLAHAARVYGERAPLSLERLAEIAEAWRPFRTWSTVLIRLAGDRGTV